MQRTWLLWLIAAALLSPVGQALAIGPASGELRAPLAKLDTEARAAWVGTMLARLDEANGVVLSPAAVAKQRGRFEKVLAAFVADEPGWETQIARFHEELSLSQRAAIEHLTRRYRLDAYQSFRTNRAAFEQRRSHLAKLLGSWRRSASADGERYKVIQWLIAANRLAADSGLAQLPPLPRFDGEGGEGVVDRAIAAADSSEPRRLPAAALPEIPISAPPLAPRTGVPLSGPRPADLLADRGPSEVGPLAVRPATFHTPARIEMPTDVHQSAPRPLHAQMQPSFEPSGFVATLKPATVAYSSRRSWRRPSSVASVTRPVSQVRPRFVSRSTVSPRRSPDPLAFARTKVDRLAMGSTYRRPSPTSDAGLGTIRAVPERSSARGSNDGGLDRARPVGSGSYAATTSGSGMGDDDVIATRNAGVDGGTAYRSDDMTATPNMEELAARIRGNNMALRRLGAKLYEERGWNAESLTRVLDELAPLVARKDDLKLIRELIPADQRGRVGDLETGSDLISDLGSKIARARSQVNGENFPGSSAARRRELDRLDQLSQKLADLVFSGN